MHRLLYCLLGLFALSLSFSACDNGAPPSGSAVRNRDSLPVMVTYGVSKLISDSGVVRYKIISEEWLVFDRTHPPRQEFRKGVLLQRYDDRLNVDLSSRPTPPIGTIKTSGNCAVAFGCAICPIG